MTYSFCVEHNDRITVIFSDFNIIIWLHTVSSVLCRSTRPIWASATTSLMFAHVFEYERERSYRRSRKSSDIRIDRYYLFICFGCRINSASWCLWCLIYTKSRPKAKNICIASTVPAMLRRRRSLWKCCMRRENSASWGNVGVRVIPRVIIICREERDKNIFTNVG